MPLGGRTATRRNLGVACLLLGLIAGSVTWSFDPRPAAGRTPGPAAGRPFRLPFEDPPGAGTWLLGQPFGNTTGAYRLGDVWYAAGQGLHFGVDFLAPCGTPLVAVGDGEVVQADWAARGSGPHNLVLRFPAQGVTVLYGHLLERPRLEPGQPVHRGARIALSGDPDATCDSRPHLHLEVRSLDYRIAYNPLDWIEADWDALFLIGPFSDVSFVRDREHPRRWVEPRDQPVVRFGGPKLNAFPGWPEKSADAACVVSSC